MFFNPAPQLLRNPQFPTKTELWRYKCFVSYSQAFKQSSGTEIQVSQTATHVDQDDFDKML